MKSSKSGSNAQIALDVIKEEKHHLVESKELTCKEELDSLSSSSSVSSPKRRTVKMEKQSDSESETEALRQAALDSEVANLRKKVLTTNGPSNAIVKQEATEEIEDGEVIDKGSPI